MSREVQIEGAESLIERFDKMIDEQKMQEALRTACALVERTAKQKAPKDTGELRRSITSEINGLTGAVFTPLLYAPYVEYGIGLFAEDGGRQDVPWYYQDDKRIWHKTSGLHPHPYLRPALEENREDIKQLLKGALL